MKRSLLIFMGPVVRNKDQSKDLVLANKCKVKGSKNLKKPEKMTKLKSLTKSKMKASKFKKLDSRKKSELSRKRPRASTNRLPKI